MKICSWNMFFKNPDVDRALEFMASSDFDVISLQEVPESLLPRLEALPYFYDRAIEMDHNLPEGPSTRNLVILSRYPIKRSLHIPLPYREPTLKRRAKLVVKIMTGLGIWGLGTGNRHTQIVDIEADGNVTRVINVHLPLATPEWRVEELEWALEHKDPALPTIICGDFNILEHPLITPLTWLLGGTLGDVLFYKRERTLIEKRFVEHRLTNAHRGKRTHAISRSQLDHILVSEHFTVQDASVFTDAYGSDHQPIVVEIEKK